MTLWRRSSAAGRYGFERDRREGRRRKWRIRECRADRTLDKNRIIAKLRNTLATSLQTLTWTAQQIADAQLEIAERVKDMAANEHEFQEVTLARESWKAD